VGAERHDAIAAHEAFERRSREAGVGDLPFAGGEPINSSPLSPTLTAEGVSTEPQLLGTFRAAVAPNSQRTIGGS
jgi:hypothetical protein